MFELTRTLRLPLPLPPQKEIDRQVAAASAMLDRLAKRGRAQPLDD